MMTKKGLQKILDPWGRVHVFKLYISEYALSSTLSIYNTLIAIALRDYNAVFLCLVDFYLTMMGLLICKYEPFLQEGSVECLILR